MLGLAKKIERVIILSLVALMLVVVLLSTVELAWVIAKDIITPPLVLLEIAELLEIFGLFLLVLIGIELLEMIKVYLEEQVVHVEVVLMVAMVAIARKVVILDVKELSGLTLVGIGAVILALSVGYFLVKRTHKRTEAGPP
ncbi:MAG: phosphate-starvation-inducible PsiE family protein [Nitrospirota bacterium]